jgi:hypothetical protein
MFGSRSGRYDASAFASVGPNYHKDAVVKPTEAAETFLVRVWVVAVEAVRVIESQSRHVERDAMVVEVACAAFLSSHSNSSSCMTLSHKVP